MTAHPLRSLVTLTLAILLAASLLACGNDDERIRDLEETIESLEESVGALESENADLTNEIAGLRQEQADLAEALETAETVIEEQGGQLTALQEELLLAEEFTDGLGDLFKEFEEAAEEIAEAFGNKDEWPTEKDDDDDEKESPAEDSVLEITAELARDSGGSVHYIDHAGRNNRSVLVTPTVIVDGRTPLIVSLHGYGGDSAGHAAYIPFHERVNRDGFALLLPNGILDAEGNRFWNPTDEIGDAAKGGLDDVAYLTELVASAHEVANFGHVYFFGYSNGGFMSYHMACKGLTGLRAVASLAGTSYVKDDSCAGAPPVSVLHIHGDADDVIHYAGAQQYKTDTKDDAAGPAFYVGAEEMVTRWSQRANCAWPRDAQPYATFDYDRFVAGAETQAFRQESGCAEGTTIELWRGVGSSHALGYDDAFVEALITWLLAQA